MKRNLFRRALACLCLCAVLSGGLCVPARAAGFRDVPAGHWAADAISQCVTQGWFQGKSADTFGVGQPMTRSAFAVVLSRFFGWQSSGAYYQIFSDVPQGAWYEPALRACYEHGAVTRQTGTYRPGDAVTREELAVTLIRALGYGPIAGLAGEDTLPFRDVTTNRGHIAMAYAMGLVSGTGQSTFAPDRAATREQAAVMLSRLYHKLHPAGSGETILLLQGSETLPETADCTTLVLMAGTLTGGQSAQLSVTLSAAQSAALAQKNGLILLTDSDAAGFRIRTYITNLVGEKNVVQAYVPAIHGKEKRKEQPGKEGLLGVEGVDDAIVLQALRDALGAEAGAAAARPEGRQITYTDLYEWGLSGRPGSAERKAKLLNALGLPPRLSKKELVEALNRLYTFEQLNELQLKILDS